MSDTPPTARDDPRGALPAPINVLRPTEDGPTIHPVEARCPYCAADLSTVSVGRYLITPAGTMVEVLAPVKCPECLHALLFLSEPSKITRPGGPLPPSFDGRR